MKEVTASSLVVTTADGHEAAFTITAETRFRRGDAPARREDVHPGERAVVHGKTHGDHLDATEIRLPAERQQK